METIEDKKNNQNPQSTSSRVLKFRAWDNMAKCWVKMEQLLDDVKVGATVLPPSILSMGHDERTFMQYTGVKDKNGKEVYEADILEFDGQPIRGHIERDKRYGQWALVYYEEKANGELRKQSSSLYRYTELPEPRWTVVGNMYENGEKLTHLLSKV